MASEEVSLANGLRGIFHGGKDRSSVIISHGAGQGMQSPILKKTAEQLADLGFNVLRFNFAYIDKKSAPSLGGKKELPDMLAAIEYMSRFGPPILIGKSFGARVCANAAIEIKNARALVFYGLPLQGASPTAKPRDWSHLSKITCPILFITGDKDKLCPLDKLEEVQKTLKANYQSEVVPGDHSFKPKSEDLAIRLCVDWIEKEF